MIEMDAKPHMSIKPQLGINQEVDNILYLFFPRTALLSLIFFKPFNEVRRILF